MFSNVLPGLGNQELSDPAWRRWFDILKAQGVDQLSDNAIGALKGMWSMPAPSQPTFNPSFQASAQSQTPLNGLTAGTDALQGLIDQGKLPTRRPRRQQALPESNDQFKARYGR